MLNVGDAAAVMAVCAVITWYAWIIRAERRQLRLYRGQCVECGYDLRASKGNCPECNKPIPLRVSDLIERGEAIVKIDVPCMGCGGNLVGKYNLGKCDDCWTDIQSSIRQDVAVSLGVDLDQVKFIETAMYERWHSRPIWRKHSAAHIDAREVCIAVRDFAKRLKWRRAAAKALLLDLGIQGSDQIGDVICGLVDRGTYQALPSDRREQFHGLFTLDQLMNARGHQHPRPATT